MYAQPHAYRLLEGGRVSRHMASEVLLGDPECTYHVAPRLDERVLGGWHRLAEAVPWADYRQNPAWAETQQAGSGITARTPYYFWVERGAELILTGVGMRRALPVPGRAFWEFDGGPVFSELSAFENWLPWLVRRMRPDAARIRMAPGAPLESVGDDVETVLEVQGFERRRRFGGWATIVERLPVDEDALMKGFRSSTRQRIRRGDRLGIKVTEEDDQSGWTVLSWLLAELARSSPVSRVSPQDLSRVSRGWLCGGPGGTVLVARKDREALAAALVIRDRDTAHLRLLASSKANRQLPASHSLVWETMRWALRQGCSYFDVDGYSLRARPGDPLWGVNEFKRGFVSLDGLRRCVAIHELASSPLVAAAANAVRDAQSRIERRMHGGEAET
jgi:hypothetical protein